MREAERALAEALNEACQEDWDGIGAAPVEPSTYIYAHNLLRLLPEGAMDPEIYADRDGDICFDWDRGRRCVLTVCVSRDGTLTYAALFGHIKSHGVELLAEGIPEIIATNLERVAARWER